MSILDKLQFWKHDDPDFDSLLDKEMAPPQQEEDHLGLDQKHLGLEERSPFDQDSIKAQGGRQPPPVQPNLPSEPQSYGRHQLQNQPMPNTFPGNNQELINSKLDTIKAILNSMDQRLMNLERNMGTDKKNNRLW